MYRSSSEPTLTVPEFTPGGREAEHAYAPDYLFDALGPQGEGRSFRFGGASGIVRASSLEEVEPALSRIRQWVHAGGHAAGYLAYEAAAAFAPELVTLPPRRDLPLLEFCLFEERLPIGAPCDPPAAPGSYAIGPLRPALEPAGYAESIERIAQRIASGALDEVNFTFPLRASFRGDPLALYRDLVRAQRSGFCALLPAGEQLLLSASPELFLKLRGAEVEVRPMKGTRPRGRWSAEDDRLAEELLGSEKDRRENLLTLEIVRDDLARVTEPGSLEASELLAVERYPTVHQLTSTLRGRLRPGLDLLDLLRALFPSGSITGAPRNSAMELIRELETTPRGPYTGAIGFWSPDEAVFSVAIRTLIVDPLGGELELGIGSGITSASEAGQEYQECLDKSAFLYRRQPDFELLESLRLELPGGYRFLPEHLERLEKSARYFGFAIDRERIRAALEEYARGLGAEAHLTSPPSRSALASDLTDPMLPPWMRSDSGIGALAACKVRLRIDREGGLRIEHQQLSGDPAPVRLRIGTLQVDETDPFLYHKTTARTLYQRALAQAEGVDDVVLINRRDQLTETTTANLVLELAGERVTPPLASGLLPGVLRARALARGEIQTRILRPEDLRHADSIYLINAVRGWRRGVLV